MIKLAETPFGFPVWSPFCKRTTGEVALGRQPNAAAGLSNAVPAQTGIVVLIAICVAFRLIPSVNCIQFGKWKFGGVTPFPTVKFCTVSTVAADKPAKAPTDGLTVTA